MSKEFIENALSLLLTPDGKGRTKKAKILSELCQTQNPNYVRECIDKLLEQKKLH